MPERTTGSLLLGVDDQPFLKGVHWDQDSGADPHNRKVFLLYKRICFRKTDTKLISQLMYAHRFLIHRSSSFLKMSKERPLLIYVWINFSGRCLSYIGCYCRFLSLLVLSFGSLRGRVSGPLHRRCCSGLISLLDISFVGFRAVSRGPCTFSQQSLLPLHSIILKVRTFCRPQTSGNVTSVCLHISFHLR
jgi:hypothetical protein